MIACYPGPPQVGAVYVHTSPRKLTLADPAALRGRLGAQTEAMNRSLCNA